MSDDVILSPRVNRFTLFPIEFSDIFNFYRLSVANFWAAQEVDLSHDPSDFAKLTADERHFIKQVLAFFAASDGIVNENLCFRFANEVQPAEARAFYGIQIGIETIHSEMYSLMIQALVDDVAEQNHLFNAIETVPAIARKAEWATRWIGSDAPFAQRLIAFACVEGIHFSGSFAAIFWLKKRGLMPGLCHANELISRDEGLHRDFACLLHAKLSEPCSEATVRAIVTEAVAIEQEFITDSIPVRLIGINADLMSQYIEFVADHLVRTLGFAPIYGTANPFPWMDLISMSGKTNFFERRVSEYSKAGVAHESATTFSLNEEF